jgi:hypothetical protein
MKKVLVSLGVGACLTICFLAPTASAGSEGSHPTSVECARPPSCPPGYVWTCGSLCRCYCKKGL